MRTQIILRIIYLVLFILLQLPIWSQSHNQFNEIGKIVSGSCYPCHKENNAAPFAFNDLKSLIFRASTIQKVIEAGTMPPWKADTAYSRFKNERILTGKDKSAILTWLAHTKRQALNHTIPDGLKTTSQDSLVRFTSPLLHLAANKSDTIIYQKIRYHLDKDVNAKALEIKCINTKIFHHVNITFLQIKNDSLSNPVTFTVDFDNKTKDELFYKSNVIMADGWVPGTQKKILPLGITYHLPKDGEIVLENHLSPLSIEEEGQINIELSDFTNKAERRLKHYSIGSFGNDGEPYPPIVIPPDSMLTVVCKSVINKEFTILSMNPHMHYLGKEFRAFAISPMGDTMRLVKINDWDFNWQEFYVPNNTIPIAKGTTIYVIGTFDNTTNNKRNPNNSKRYVMQGRHSSDEMIDLNLEVVDYKKGDEFLKN